MNKLVILLAALALAAGGSAAFAADAPKDASSKDAKMAPAKLEKPANVTQEAWDKMSDADKKKAVEAAKMASSKDAQPKKKKGGC